MKQLTKLANFLPSPFFLNNPFSLSIEFRYFIIIIIIASALLVGVKTYPIPEWMILVIDGLDLLITLIFVVEISVRFLGESRKRDFFKNGWNIFDTLIVAVSLIPIDDTDMALVARLIRVFRVLRMISIIPELRILLNSLLQALPRLGYVAALIFIIFLYLCRNRQSVL